MAVGGGDRGGGLGVEVQPRGVAVGGDGSAAISCAEDGGVCAINLRSRGCEWRRERGPPQTCVHALGSAHALCAGEDGAVDIWSLREGGAPHALQTPSGVGVCAMHVHGAPNGTSSVALGNADGVVSVWRSE